MRKKALARPLPRVRLGRPIAVRTYTPIDPARSLVVLEIGKPRRVRGWDWACPVRISGLSDRPSTPRPVFGIDAVQAIELAIDYSRATIESALLEDTVKQRPRRRRR